LNASAAGRELLSASLNNVKTHTETHPESDALAEYAQLNWHITDRLTLTTGGRFTSEERTNDTITYLESAGVDLAQLGATNGATAGQISAASAIRSDQALSKLQAPLKAKDRNDSFAWLVTPSFKLTPDVLLYASVSYGEKSPIVDFFGGTALVSDPEKVDSYELGLKTVLFKKRLRLNANLYDTIVSGYQTDLRALDPTSITGAYITKTGNVPEIRSRGLEFDGVLQLLHGLDFTFSGAYNDAIYTDFHYGPLAGEEVATSTYQYKDYTGKQLSGAPKASFRIGLNYSVELSKRYVLRASIADAYRSKANIASTLSQYGWQGSYSIVDASIGVGTRDGTFEVNIIGKNLFDQKYIQSFSDLTNSGAARGGVGERQIIYVAFRANY
jgi:iron complex outermembrane receptor protein